MLTLAYCRVSTEEQAEEGYSIEGQADKLRDYARLRGLGDVLVVTDPGKSGKNLNRPGLQQVLAAIEAGHVSHVLVWRLDRLSRNLADLILLADTFGEQAVALHSVSENLDLSSAAGRMFYNILGTFAQYFRESLVENVKLGNERAIKEGRHINRAKLGYSMVDGRLVPNSDAVMVREIFSLRSDGLSYRQIEERTGVLYSTVSSVLHSRVYLGEIPHNGKWFPGIHDPIITAAEFHAAHRGFGQGVRRVSDVLSGKVVCGLCERRMAVNQNGQGSRQYKCRSRGQGCAQPARSTAGLTRAAVLGLALIGDNAELQEAIRRYLRSGGSDDPRKGGTESRRAGAARRLKQLSDQRFKLLQLYYRDRISEELFTQDESRITREIACARDELQEADGDETKRTDLEARFEQVAAILRELDVAAMWQAATEPERRLLIEEMIESVRVFPDHLEVQVSGAPALNVLPGEVGLKQSEVVGVGGGT